MTRSETVAWMMASRQRDNSTSGLSCRLIIPTVAATQPGNLEERDELLLSLRSTPVLATVPLEDENRGSPEPVPADPSVPIIPIATLEHEVPPDEGRSLGASTSEQSAVIVPVDHEPHRAAVDAVDRDTTTNDLRPPIPPHSDGPQSATAQIKVEVEVAALPPVPAAPANENLWEMMQIEAVADIILSSRAGSETLQITASQLNGMHFERAVAGAAPRVIAKLDGNAPDHDELVVRALHLMANPHVDGVARRQASNLIELRIRERVAMLRVE
jgi:hypothetical protein